MPRYLDIEITGVQTVRRQLLRGAAAAANMRPALWEIREDIFRIIRINFISQGRRGGGSWKQLDPRTAAAKARRGQDPRILIATGKLMDSFTRRGSRYMRSAVNKDRIYLDTTLPYADTHQYGDQSRGIPTRPFIRFLPQDKKRWVKMCESHLMEAMRGG